MNDDFIKSVINLKHEEDTRTMIQRELHGLEAVATFEEDDDGIGEY